MADPSLQRTGLPWSSEPGERLRLGLSLGLMVLLFLPLAVMITRIELPEPERSDIDHIPPQLARLVEQPQPPEPVPPEPESDLPEVPEPDPAPEISEVEPVAKPKPELKPEPKTELKPKPAIRPEQTVVQARAVASRSGLLAMQDQLAAMRDPESPTSSMLVANVDGGRTPETTISDKAVALQGSGGVRAEKGPVREVALADHDVQQIAAPIEKSSPAPDAGPTDLSRAQRAMSNIRRVFDSHKTALFAIYNRELRQDPTLEGKVMLELVIEPDGRVSDCKVVSSELGNPALETRLANRVRLFNFGEAKVDARTVRFPIDFLPS